MEIELIPQIYKDMIQEYDALATAQHRDALLAAQPFKDNADFEISGPSELRSYAGNGTNQDR